MSRLAKVVKDNRFLGTVMANYSTTAQVIQKQSSKSGDFCGGIMSISEGDSCELVFDGGETIQIEITNITRPVVNQISAKFNVIG